MSKILSFPKSKSLKNSNFIGPLEKRFWQVKVDGYLVPNLEAVLNDNDTVTLRLDGRFEIDVSNDDSVVHKWLWLLAHGMAISAGLSCHGEHSQPRNLFKNLVCETTVVEES